MSSDLFLMSPPGADWRLRGRSNFRSRDAEDVDPGMARQEWDALARTIVSCGGRVCVLEPQANLTGLPFCAEAGQALPPPNSDSKALFVLPRMQSEHRGEEWRHWQPLVETLGFRVERPSAGVWEGQGDVAEFRGRTLLFHGGRTDASGLQSVRGFFPSDALEIEIRQPAFHGNVACLPIESIDRLVVCPEFLVGDSLARLEDHFGSRRLLAISAAEAKSYTTNALPLGRHLLAPSIVPARILELLQQEGMTVHTLVMTELCEKAGGASRCLVCRIPASIAEHLQVPAELLWT